MKTKSLIIVSAIVGLFIVNGVIACGGGPSAPTAIISATPTSLIAPGPVSFDGSASTANSGTITEYRWDFDDNTGYSYEATVDHQYITPGIYEVELRVKNSYDKYDTETCTIIVDSGAAPTPDPMTWTTAPYAMSPTCIAMQATQASDPSGGIQYYFDETSGNPGGEDSGWQSSRIYTDTELTPGTPYTYRVKAKDSLGIETDWSDGFSATTRPDGFGIGCTIHVPYHVNTIQGAIDMAVNGCTIVIAKGTYTGPGNRDLDFNGKAITVRSTDPNDPAVVAETIIDCQGSSSSQHRGFVFHMGEGNSSVVSGLTIKNGFQSVDEGGGAAPGGGIFCIHSSPTITNCNFINNFASHSGGGLYNYDNSSPVVMNCIFSGNEALGYGGGMLNWRNCSPIVTNCVFANNHAYNERENDGMINSYNSSPIITTSHPKTLRSRMTIQPS